MPDQSQHRRLLTVNRTDLRNSLASLAGRVHDYSQRLRDAGFKCCHVNDDWIEQQCSPADAAAHKRYLVEYAQEVLASDDRFSILPRDELNCRSPWLNELKARRLSAHGPADELGRSAQTRYLVQLSPGWQEFMRVRESAAPMDQMQVSDQATTYAHRRAKEIEEHAAAIAACAEGTPQVLDEMALQAFFAESLLRTFEKFGMRIEKTLRRNQVLQRDESITAGVFEIIADEVLFVLLPAVVSTSTERLAIPAGTLGIGFRLMTPSAFAAPVFNFGRDTVLHLQELLPNQFGDYGQFSSSNEFCLNILAWTAALRILLPDVLQTLRDAAAESGSTQHH